jgi:hypothetical protein
VAEHEERRRQRFTPFGLIVFILSIVLLLSKLTGWMTGAEDLVTRLALGFKQVNAFAFAVNYKDEFFSLIAPAPPSQPTGLLFSPPPSVDAESSGMSIPLAVFAAFPAAIKDSLAGGGWATLGLLLSLGFGLIIMWDEIKESWLWVAAVPFVGGAIAWALSMVVIQFLLWAVLVALQALVLIGGVSSVAPHVSEAVADLLDKFHLTKSVASDASRVFGRGKIAEALERIERRPPD